MHHRRTYTIVLACLAGAAAWGWGGPDESGAETPKPGRDEVRTVCTAAQIAEWETRAV
ncbi:MAG: hypothetical protein H8E53_04860, partial [Planctomycetes bacterium]|nr:hypothetical protein [Planctomycetota bacterium]